MKMNEDMRRKYVEMWDAGEFRWNHHVGDKTRSKSVSLERVWQTFIEPALTAKDAEIATAYTRGKERVEEIYSHFSWCQECAEGPMCKDALAIKDNLK